MSANIAGFLRESAQRHPASAATSIASRVVANAALHRRYAMRADQFLHRGGNAARLLDQLGNQDTKRDLERRIARLDGA